MRGILLFVVMALGVADAATAADFSFDRPSRLTLARNSTGGIAIGDANGDGRMDIAITEDVTTNAHLLSLFVQRADGTFASPVMAALPGDFGWGFPVSFADLDRDGAAEILVGASQLQVWRFAGGALTPIASQPAKYTCAYIVAGDIDADGKMDAVCHSGLGTPTAATLFYGNGAGGFRATAELQTDVGTYGTQADFMSVQLADVTGDGLLDLLVTASRVDKFFVYANDGLGGFFSMATAYPHPLSPSGVWPAALRVADLDGDGVNEVITANPDNRPDARLNIYRRGMDGKLALSKRVPIYDSTTAILATDVDGDGRQELVTAHYGFNAISLLDAGAIDVAGGQPRFDLPGFSSGVGQARPIGTANALALGDLNGDGCVDLAGSTHSGVLLLYGCRPFKSQVPVSDFDGDGVSDLLWRNDGTTELYMWQWASFYAWQGCASPCPRHKVPPWMVQVVGDFDGDGNTDVFWRNLQNGSNAFLASAFYERTLTAVANQDWQVVAAGDFDGDDHSDLFWRNNRNGANAIWRSADYHKQQTTVSVTNLAWQVVGVGDFNGDGRSDVLWRHAVSGSNAIWLSGRHETQRAITGVTNPQWRVQGVGDFNGDGQDDIAWRNTVNGVNAIWLSADYRKQQVVSAVTNAEWNIGAVGDYNGDGRSDLMWRNRRTGANAIWRSARYDDQQLVEPFDTFISLLR